MRKTIGKTKLSRELPVANVQGEQLQQLRLRVEQLEGENQQLKAKLDLQHQRDIPESSYRESFFDMSLSTKAGGLPTEYQAAGGDDSSSRQVEKALAESEYRYQKLFESVPVGLGMAALDGQILMANAAIAEVVGCTVEECVKGDAIDFYADGGERAEILKILKAQGGLWHHEVKLKRRNGEIFWADMSKRLIPYQGRDVILTVLVDLSDRKEAEDKIRAAEAKFRAIFHNVTHGVVIGNPEGRFLFFNRRFHEMLGYTADEFSQKTIWDITYPDDREASREKVKMMMEGRVRSARLEKRYIKKDGSIFWADVCIEPIRSADGKVETTAAIVVDINDRKKKENGLRESEELLSHALEIAKAGVWTWNVRTDEIQLCPRIMKMLGYKRHQLPQTLTGLRVIGHPDERQRIEETLRIFSQGEIPAASREFRLRCADGNWLWVSIRARAVEKDAQDRPIRIIGTCLDISEHKQAIRNLQQSEERFRLAAETVSDLIYEWDLASDEVTWFGDVDMALGYPPGTFVHTLQGWQNHLHPDDYARVCQELKEFRGREGLLYLEYRIGQRDGEWRNWIERGTAVNDENGRPYKVIGVCSDVTERTRAEQALRDSEKLLRQVIDTAPLCIFVKDQRGQYVLVNEGLAALFQTTQQEMIGRTDQNLAARNRLSEAAAGRFARQDKEVIEKKKPLFISHEEITIPGGPTRTFQTVKVPIFLSGAGPCVLGVAVDITEQHQARQELINSRQEIRNLAQHLYKVKEENKIHLARELHDRLGQNLAVLRMDISRMIKQAPHPPAALKSVNALLKVVDESIDVIHRICADLRPGLLDDFGLKAAFEQLSEEFGERTGLVCEFHGDVETDGWNKDLATNLYRIAQEALNNIDRHAKARRVRIELLQKNQDIILKIEDDGVGIRPEAISRSDSFGLIGMRERTNALGGQFHIEGSPGAYTRITVTVPLNYREDRP